MEHSAFHFAHNAWLWGLLAIPVMAILYGLLYRPTAHRSRLEQFADRHLLPHLLTGGSDTGSTIKRSVFLWSCIWALGVIGMAGPRWNYTDMETFKPQQNMVVLLDLSKSMDAGDVKPSRLMQAREKLNDLLKMAKGMNIGLVGYAADAHMISPITDDTKPILALLPDIDTSLAYVQGNNLKPALEMASRMLNAEPGKDKSILVISDGGWHDGDSALAEGTVSKNIPIYTIGIGTLAGAPIPAQGGGWIKDTDGKMVISHLQEDKLQALSKEHDGIYKKSDYTDGDVTAILSRIKSKNEAAEATGHKTRYWEEHFYIPVMLMALLILPWFRRGYIFPVLAFLCFSSLSGENASAATLQDLFLNKAQQAHTLFNKGDYKAAASTFDTPYRRGVAEYKAGEFDKAEKSFAEAQGNTPSAEYNRGNAQVMQGKYEDAIASYESVLKHDPHNANASHNLDIARKLLQLQKQQHQQNKDQNKESKQQQNGKKPSSQQSSSGKGQDSQKNASANGQQKPQDQKQADKGSTSKVQGNDQKQENQQKPDDKAQQQVDSKQSPQGQNNVKGNQLQPQNNQPMQDSQKEEKGQHLQQAKQLNATQQSADKDNVDATAKPDTGPMAAAQERRRTQKDIDADQWLGRIENDPQSFLKNQFQVETQSNGTAQGDQPW